MKKTQLIITLGAIGAASLLFVPTADAVCTVADDSCKETFGCAPCNAGWVLGIVGTGWQSASYTDNDGHRTSYRTRRTSAGNGGGLVVDTTEVGTSFHRVSGSIACTGGSTSRSPVIGHTSVQAETVFCPPGTTPRRADTRIVVPDFLCVGEQLCGLN